MLAPYEVLAEARAFNLYLTAPERRPLPLTGGLDVVPDLRLSATGRQAADHSGRDHRAGTAQRAGEPSATAVEDWLRRGNAPTVTHCR